MSNGEFALIVPFGDEFEERNGLFCRLVTDQVEATLIHSKRQGRERLETVRGESNGEAVEANLGMLERSTLPEESERDPHRFSPLLSGLLISTIMHATNLQQGERSVTMTASLKPRFCQFVLPSVDLMPDGLLSLVDAGPQLYVLASKEHARLAIARHAHMTNAASHARLLAAVDACALPETCETPLLQIGGSIAFSVGVSFEAVDAEELRRASSN